MNTTPHTTRRRFIALLAGAAAVLAACGGTNDAASESAAESSDNVAESTETTVADLRGETITVYSGRSESLVAPLFTAFTEATGINVDVRYGDTGELAALLLTEGDKSPADVYFSQDAGALGAVGAAGLLTALPSDVTELVDARFRSTSDQWVATSGRARVLVYNTELVPTPPASLDELLDPQWKGKIGFAPTNASWQSFVTALRVARGEDGARAWLTGFAANEAQPYEKNGAVRDAVNAGEISLGLINHYYLYELITKVGQDNVVAKNHYFRDGDAGSLINIAGAGVLASSTKQEAALAFVRYLLSSAGQAYFTGKTFEYPMISGVIPFFELPSLDELNPPSIDLSDLQSLEATQEMLVQVGLLTK
jgi:iron(III) transport system substrate-binding protein